MSIELTMTYWQTRLKNWLITFNNDYLFVFFMLLLALAMEIAPFDPLMIYLRNVSGYGAVGLKYTMLLFALLLWRAAPSRSPMNVLLTWPLLALFATWAQYQGHPLAEVAVGEPWVSRVLIVITVVIIVMMGLSNFMFKTLYEALENTEVERQQKDTHAADE